MCEGLFDIHSNDIIFPTGLFFPYTKK